VQRVVNGYRRHQLLIAGSGEGDGAGGDSADEPAGGAAGGPAAGAAGEGGTSTV
jgi:hypothetical protein